MSWNSSHVQQRLNYPTGRKHHAAFQLATAPVVVFRINTDKPRTSNRALQSPCLHFQAFDFFPIPSFDNQKRHLEKSHFSHNALQLHVTYGTTS